MNFGRSRGRKQKHFVVRRIRLKLHKELHNRICLVQSFSFLV